MACRDFGGGGGRLLLWSLPFCLEGSPLYIPNEIPIKLRSVLSLFPIPTAAHPAPSKSIHQLDTAHLPLLQLLQPNQHPLQPPPTAIHIPPRRQDLPLGQQPPRQLPKHLPILIIRRNRRQLGPRLINRLPQHGIRQPGPIIHPLIRPPHHRVVHPHQRPVVALPRRAQRRRARLGRPAAADAVPRQRQRVGVGAPGLDVVDRARRAVVEGAVGAEGLDVGEVGRGAGGGDAVAG